MGQVSANHTLCRREVVKALLAVVYGMLRDVDLVMQLVSSISRQAKLIEDKAIQ